MGKSLKRRARKKSDAQLAQDRINTESDAVKILGMLIRFQSERAGISWNTETIAKMGRMTNVKRAIDFLDKYEFVGRKGESYYPTLDGREFYESSKTNSYSGRPGDAYEFRVEVLEGITHRGDKTKIDSPVLPSSYVRYHETSTPEAFMMMQEKASQIQEKIKQEFGYSDAKFFELYKAGLVQYCSGCLRVRIFKARDSILCLSCEGGKR